MRWVPEVYIALKPGFHSSRSIEDKVVRAIETVIGKIAAPKHVRIVPKIVERIPRHGPGRGEGGDLSLRSQFGCSVIDVGRQGYSVRVQVQTPNCFRAMNLLCSEPRHRFNMCGGVFRLQPYAN